MLVRVFVTYEVETNGDEVTAVSEVQAMAPKYWATNYSTGISSSIHIQEIATPGYSVDLR